MLDSFSAGYDYISKQLGASQAAAMGADYVSKVDSAIEDLVQHMNELGKKGLDPKQLKGFVAEYWHADVFNINAALHDSSHHAHVEASNDFASVDVSTNFGEEFSLKYLWCAKESVRAQAQNIRQAYHKYLHEPRQGIPMSFEQYIVKNGYADDPNIAQLIKDYQQYRANNPNESIDLEQFINAHTGDYDITSLLTSIYNGQNRLIPSDQLKDAISFLERKIAEESHGGSANRLALLENYKETLERLVDRISDGEGVESIPLSKEEAEKIAAMIKDGTFSPEDFGLSLNDLITSEYILKQSLKAGYSAAIITLVLQLAPELIKSVLYLIKNGEIDIDQLKHIGVTAISAPAEGFLRGSVSSALTIACKAGKLGQAFVGINPHVIGALTVIVVDVAKSSILVASGKMSPREMGNQITREILISSASLAFGAIGQAIAPQLPVLGFMLGSMLGSCVASAVLCVTDKILISFCVDTGFTCFGLVEQDYQLPEYILNDMGIKTITIPRIEVNKVSIKQIPICTIETKRVNVPTIELVMVRRGVIGINKIGFI